MNRLRLALAALSCSTALLAVPPSSAFAQATLFPSASGTALPSSLATPSGRGASNTAEMTARINAMSARPIASPAPQPVVRPDMQWVPDRYVSVPGAPQGVLVIGHWEQRLDNGRVYVPPVVIAAPPGEPGLIPAGERPPVEVRVGP